MIVVSVGQKTYIVTGAAGALGSVVARRFVDEGANVVLPVRAAQRNTLSDRMKDASSHVLLVEADVSQEGDAQRVINEAIRVFNGVHGLVNIAGGYAGGRTIAEAPLSELHAMLEKNLQTAFVMSRAVLNQMLDRGWGRIVNIGAMPALTSGAKKGPYAIAKRAVISLTEVIADEVRGTGVTANVIVPSIIRTEDNVAAMPHADTSLWVTPEAIAEAVLFLCSDASRSINGSIIKMYGGL